jgi:hypothetical protein
MSKYNDLVKDEGLPMSINECFKLLSDFCRTHLPVGATWQLERDVESLGPVHLISIQVKGLYDGYGPDTDVQFSDSNEAKPRGYIDKEAIQDLREILDGMKLQYKQLRKKSAQLTGENNE